MRPAQIKSMQSKDWQEGEFQGKARGKIHMVLGLVEPGTGALLDLGQLKSPSGL